MFWNFSALVLKSNVLLFRNFYSTTPTLLSVLSVGL